MTAPVVSFINAVPGVERMSNSTYYDRLLGVTTHSAWEDWILYMLEAVRETADWSTARIRAIRDLLDQTAEQMRRALDRAAHRNRSGGRDWTGLERLKSLAERRAVAQGFLCRRIGLIARLIGKSKKPVCGGHDVFDLGTCLGFEQRNRVDQHGLIWNELA